MANSAKIAAFVIASFGVAQAQQGNDRDWPSVVPTPILDAPMRDAAVTRAPDGTYYLPGTSQGRGPSGELGFDNGRQFKLWHSKDFKTWTELCVAYNLERPNGKHEKHEKRELGKKQARCQPNSDKDHSGPGNALDLFLTGLDGLQ